MKRGNFIPLWSTLYAGHSVTQRVSKRVLLKLSINVIDVYCICGFFKLLTAINFGSFFAGYRYF